MARLEKTYQGELKRSFDHYLSTKNKHGVWWKIPDTGYGKKPYDNWCVTEGKFYAMEQKINKSVKTFNFNTFFRDRTHELECLKRVEQAGGIAYITINHYSLRKWNKAYAMRISVGERAYEKGSIKLDDIINHPEVIEIPRLKGGLWDLSVIFDK